MGGIYLDKSGMSKFENLDAPVSSNTAPYVPIDVSELQVLKKIDAAKTSAHLPEMQTPPELPTTDLKNITLSTPAQDASTHTQPDYYLDSEGKLVRNPLAKPSPDGKIRIEVEGNNSAKKAEQYASKLQKETISYLIQLFKQSNPGAKVPEMWQSILDSTPDSSYPNDGDSQNNNTVSSDQLDAYNSGKAAPPDLPPDNGAMPPSQPSEGSGGSDGGGGSASGGSGPPAESNIPNQVSGNGGASTDGLQISSGSMQNYDGTAEHMSAMQTAVTAEATHDLGSAMWGGWSGASADLGCAASVSQILNNAGAASLHNAQDDNCDGLQADLLAQGWTITDKPQPGDVWIGRGGASDAHTGIVGENFTLMDNHSNNGLWSQDSASYTGQWSNSVYLKPPEQNDNRKMADSQA